MEKRTKNSYQSYLHDFLKSDILIVCPACSRQAIVKSDNFSFAKKKECDVKAICTSCGFSKQLLQKPASLLYHAKEKATGGRHLLLGCDVDPFFFFPVWLTTSWEGHSLWAYNFQHLNFIKEHVEAKLRERNGQMVANRSLGSRLPKWMTSRKNRDAVLKKILELQNK